MDLACTVQLGLQHRCHRPCTLQCWNF